MGKFKAVFAEMVENAREAIDSYEGEEQLEVNYLDAVESAGEKPDWVINVGSIVIADGLSNEREAEQLLDLIAGALEGNTDEEDEETLEDLINPNGSLLTPDTLTYCGACHETTNKDVDACPTCGSSNVEKISEI